jgi:uncharacterized Zn finger protein (UPF0148 family)
MLRKRERLKKIRKFIFIMKNLAKNICPDCGSPKIVRKIGEVSCKKCGLVIDDNIVYCE